MEENPYARSHGSYASSAAMPENWGFAAENSRNMNAETFYEESMTDISPRSFSGDFGDESRLVQPAELDSTAIAANQQQHTGTNQAQEGAEVSNANASWNVLGAARRPSDAANGESVKDDGTQAYAVPSTSAPTEFRMGQASSTNNPRNSALKRGLRIDMNAVREAESRGSLTSLPDLIRRATKLAAMIDKGKRPTSRMDTMSDFLSEKQLSEGRGDTRGGRPASGLSDMLAAFPPPVSTPVNNGPARGSWLGQGGWPLKAGAKDGAANANQNGNTKRRCCGLPLWAVIVATILLLCIIIAAIAVPLELFVFNKNDSPNDNGIDKCRKDLTCLNGGTNVIARGTCSCICSGGFTGPDCGIAGSVGCTTTDLVSPDKTSMIQNVTLGQALPRLIAEANTNFSIPLSGTSILAKINTSGLSCIAQNSLVTFNGRSVLATSDRQTIPKVRKRSLRRATIDSAGQINDEELEFDATRTNPRLTSREVDAGIIHRANDKDPFNATDTVIDFCRVSVLFVLQERSVNNAQDAQSNVQKFLTKITTAQSSNTPKITQKEASNITIGNGGSINLVDFRIDLGNGPVGGKGTMVG
ncbi:hypothetical protein V2A60_010219 [Cordyceps javanica]